ncbi:MAG TPA: NPCBM/NEW2 domain-containing protein [Planctomycetota bacterium]|jgi:hypothetical protein
MLRVTTILIVLCASVFAANDDIILSSGERLQAEAWGGRGSWRIAGRNLRGNEVLIIRFAPDPAPVRLPSGIFLRGGSLLAGTLVSLAGDTAEINSSTLGPLKLKREDIAGFFSPLPAGQPENMPELARYSNLAAAVLGAHGAALQPGQRTRVRFAGLDEVQPERVMRVGAEQILLSAKNKTVDTVNRQFVRLVEIQVPELQPSPEQKQLGPEVIVRLKGGDLLRGRVLKLDDKVLYLSVPALGEKVIDRSLLAALFLAGSENCGVTWLSTQKPARNVHTPFLDSDFPARMDASVDGGNIVVKDQPCERGIGVHSRSELEFVLPGAPAKFIALAGIDAETKGRGSVTANVLADGKEVWKSPTMTGKDAAALIAADIGAAKALVLQVDFGPDEDDSGDHFDWGWAAIVNK